MCELEACEARLAAIDARFCEAGFFERTPGAEVGQLEAERSELKARADALLREWESLEQQLAPLAEA